MNDFKPSTIHQNDLMHYLEERLNAHDDLLDSGYSWSSSMKEALRNRYMSCDVLPISNDIIEELQYDTLYFTRLVQATYRIVMQHPKYFSMLGLPKETWGCAAKEWTHLFSYFCRYDVIPTSNGNKFIGINSDAPTGYIESSIVNDYLCHIHQVASPNHLEHFIHKTWHKIFEDYAISKKETIYFTSSSKRETDKQTALFNIHNCPQLFKKYIAMENLVINEEGVFTPDGRNINFLYRMYPIEFLLDDFGLNGESVGLLLLEHIRNNKVQIINPISAFVTQSKALLVVMWEILKNEPFLYTEEEQAAVRQYVPHSSYSKEDFEGQKYVVKPLFGREGKGISIVESDGSIEKEERTPQYFNQKKIYQEYIEMPDITIDTWNDGSYTGKLLVVSFAIGGELAGIFLRVGEKVTDDLSMFVGVTKRRG